MHAHTHINSHTHTYAHTHTHCSIMTFHGRCEVQQSMPVAVMVIQNKGHKPFANWPSEIYGMPIAKLFRSRGNRETAK